MYKIDLGIQNRNLFLLKSYDGIMDVDMKNEVNAIKSKLDIIHDDVKRFIERSNQEHLASILNGCRSDFSDVIIGYATSEINDGLEDKMVGDCQVECKKLGEAIICATRPELTTEARNALEFVLAELEKGREPTSREAAEKVGLTPTGLGMALAKHGIKTQNTRRDMKSVKIYTKPMMARIKEILGQR